VPKPLAAREDQNRLLDERPITRDERADEAMRRKASQPATRGLVAASPPAREDAAAVVIVRARQRAIRGEASASRRSRRCSIRLAESCSLTLRAKQASSRSSTSRSASSRIAGISSCQRT